MRKLFFQKYARKLQISLERKKKQIWVFWSTSNLSGIKKLPILLLSINFFHNKSVKQKLFLNHCKNKD